MSMKRIMKKILAVLMSLTLMFALTACGSSNGNAGSGGTETETLGQDVQKSEQSEETELESASEGMEPEEGKTLVVYYSASKNTDAVAKYAAEAANANLFEIVPVEVYSDNDLDWTDSNSRVSVEHDNPDKRDVALVSTTVDNWEEYDTVLIGYPIWWGIAAWPVDNFVKENDFTGKTVVPFCTSASSGLGESGELLSEMAGTGEWLEGQGFTQGPSQSEVAEWIESLGL